MKWFLLFLAVAALVLFAVLAVRFFSNPDNYR